MTPWLSILLGLWYNAGAKLKFPIVVACLDDVDVCSYEIANGQFIFTMIYGIRIFGP